MGITIKPHFGKVTVKTFETLPPTTDERDYRLVAQVNGPDKRLLKPLISARTEMVGPNSVELGVLFDRSHLSPKQRKDRPATGVLFDPTSVIRSGLLHHTDATIHALRLFLGKLYIPNDAKRIFAQAIMETVDRAQSTAPLHDQVHDALSPFLPQS